MSILTATGKKSKQINKQILLILNISELEISHMFFEVADLNVDIILGLDFLKINKAVLNFESNELLLKENTIKFSKSKEKERVILKVTCNDDKRVLLWEKQTEKLREVTEVENPELVERCTGVFKKYHTVFADEPTEIKGPVNVRLKWLYT